MSILIDPKHCRKQVSMKLRKEKKQYKKAKFENRSNPKASKEVVDDIIEDALHSLSEQKLSLKKLRKLSKTLGKYQSAQNDSIIINRHIEEFDTVNKRQQLYATRMSTVEQIDKDYPNMFKEAQEYEASMQQKKK